MVAEIYIGLMTGTSADSLDIAAVNFLNDDSNYRRKISLSLSFKERNQKDYKFNNRKIFSDKLDLI